ncbi:MAG: hypothetical protein IPK00_23495 [Deltaproteobacteria bacterium]|nr:hypothetical protein [Deltaproteobacteria bacterium]
MSTGTLRRWVVFSITGAVVVSTGCSNRISASSAKESLASCGRDNKLVWATGAVPGHASEVLDVGCIGASGKRDGPAVRIVEGRAVSFANFSDGVQDGPSVVLAADGSLQAVTVSKRGVPRRAYFMSPEGWIHHSAEIDITTASTTHTYWHETGFMKNRFTTIRPDHSTDPNSAVLNGPFFAWHSDGGLLARGSYQNGEKTGPWRCHADPLLKEVSISLPDFGTLAEGDEAREALDRCVASLFQQEHAMPVASTAR